MSTDTISHLGVVESITKDNIRVKISNVSACSGCHAKGACNAADQEDKLIDAIPNGNEYKIGDMVTLIAKQSLGYKALFLGYLLPFILVLFTLILCTALGLKESHAGLLSLGVLVPYYAILYLTKDSIKKQFIFEIKP